MRGDMGTLISRARSARVIASIAFRNLVRQFRRNMLLGIGITVSMCILVVTASFTNGLTDILFNHVLIYWTGHIRVIEDSYVTRRSDIIREKARFIETIRKTVPGIKQIDEVTTTYARAIGNGRTALVALLGMPKDSTDFFTQAQLSVRQPEGHLQARRISRDPALPKYGARPQRGDERHRHHALRHNLRPVAGAQVQGGGHHPFAKRFPGHGRFH